MHARRSGRARAAAFAAPLVLVLSVWNNLVVPRLPGRPGCYVVANVSATGALLAAARRSRLSWDDMGLGRHRLPTGLAWGGASSAAVGCGYAVALVVPGLRPLLADARVAGLGRREVAFQALVRIPLGTVLWEEVAFRGVLLAALTRLVPVRTAVAASAAVFGIWHVRPTLDAVAANHLADGLLHRAAAVLAGCLGTGAAGGLLAWLRLRSGSLLAPGLLHLAANGLGILAAARAHRLGSGQRGGPALSRRRAAP